MCIKLKAIYTLVEQLYIVTQQTIAFVDVLGTGVPRLACLRPMAWLHQRPCTALPHQQTLKTIMRSQASRGGRHKASLGAASPGWLARGGEIKASGTL